MQQSEDVALAIALKEDNPQLEAPLNDIIACIQDVRGTGVTDEQLRTMVPQMFLSETPNQYFNGCRHPNSDEILVYGLDKSWQELLQYPE